jgi:hypothetical protein
MNTRIETFKTPLDESLLLARNFFELYPFDGGGCFVTFEHLGSFDDAEITDAILRRGVLAEFGSLPALDFLKFERWSTIEKTSWINRLYFLPPLARTAALRQDDAIAALVRDVILYFHRTYPPPQGKDAVGGLTRRVQESRERDYNQQGAGVDGRTEYQWFDFQPASRVVNTINAMRFLRNSPVISADDWREFDAFIYAHGETLYLDEKYHCKLELGNHQALRGLALLYCAAYFDGEDFAAGWAREGERVCDFHMSRDYLPDGTCIDISPSYHVFETWIGRDAAALAAAYGFHPNPEAFESLRRAFGVCRQFCRPDGKSLVIDDGYSLNMDIFLESFGPSFHMDAQNPFILPDARIAFARGEKYLAVLDSSPAIGTYSHYHGGKNAVTLWFGGQPFCVDSGCCNYDDPDFAEWFKQPEAHSTLLINGQGESVLQGRYAWPVRPEVVFGSWRDGAVESQLTSSAPQWDNGIWRRRLTAVGDGEIEIRDEVTLPDERNLEFIFNLHPGVTAEIACDCIMLCRREARVRLEWAADAEVLWSVHPGKVYEDFRICPTTQLRASIRGAGVLFRTAWRLL